MGDGGDVPTAVGFGPGAGGLGPGAGGLGPGAGFVVVVVVVVVVGAVTKRELRVCYWWEMLSRGYRVNHTVFDTLRPFWSLFFTWTS